MGLACGGKFVLMLVCAHSMRIAAARACDRVPVAARARRLCRVPGDQKSQIRRRKTQNSRSEAVIWWQAQADD